jgi:uncharacterized protein (TIGR03790 family)
MVIWLLACTAPGPATDGVATDTGSTGDDTGHAGDSADDTGDTESQCVIGAVTATGDAVPGGTLTLAADISVDWVVSAGTLSATTGATVTWTLPTDIAVDEPESLTATATSSCDSAEVDVDADWPIAARVVVLYNPAIEGSSTVAEAYAAFRGLSEAQLCGVESPDSTTLDGTTLATYATAVQACIDAVGPRVQYLVPVYGVPYKVDGRIPDIGGTGTLATVSLDALLVYGAGASDQTEAVYSPVYRDGDSTTGTYDPYKPFGKIRKRLDTRYYLVARIDGADADAAVDLVARTADAEALAAAGALAGTVYVDGRYGDTEPAAGVDFGSYEWGEWNMWGTRRVFEDLGTYPVVWDGDDAEFGTEPAPTTCPDALYFAGWYSYYHYNDAFTWAPGAIGGHLDSCSACDLRTGTWAAEALKRGITATFGAVNEPYVAGMPEYDQFFLYLTQGASFGEAAYESTVVGNWMMVWVGDPLYRPYPAE